MNEKLGEAVLELRTDDAHLDAGLDRALGKARRTASQMATIGAGMSAIITAPLLLFGSRARRAAVDAEELQSAFDFSFGSMAKQMNVWAEQTGDALGRSTQQLQEQSFAFNQLFKSAVNPEQAAAMSQQFTLLANDLSSFFNVAESDALLKLRAGLVGEAEPLRAFGVFLNEAAVEAKALELGIIGVNEKLTDQQKIAVRAAIILEQTKDAHGDLARTADSAANKERKLGAAFDELQVKVGGFLSDTFTPLITFMTNLITKAQTLDPQMLQMGVSIGLVAAAAGPVLLLLGGMIGSLAAIGQAVMFVSPLLAGLAIPLIKIAAVVGTVAVIWAKWEQITEYVRGVYFAAKEWLFDKLEPILTWVKGAISSVAEFFGTSTEEIKTTAADFGKTTADSFAQIFGGLGDFMGEASNGVLTGLQELGPSVIGVLDETLVAISEHPLVTEVLDGIKQKFTNFWAGIQGETAKGGEGVKGALTDISVTGEKVTKKGFAAQVGIASKAFTEIQAGLFTHSKKAFKVSKALALAQALVALPTTVMETYKNNGGWPWGLIPAGIMLGIGLGEIAQLRSVSLGGGGSGGGGASRGGGGGSSIARSALLDPAPVVSAEERNTTENVIRFDTEGGELARALANSAKQVTDEQDFVLFGDDSRQALGV